MNVWESISFLIIYKLIKKRYSNFSFYGRFFGQGNKIIYYGKYTKVIEYVDDIYSTSDFLYILSTK